MNKKWEVINMSKAIVFEVEDSYLDDIPREGIVELALTQGPEELMVTYSTGIRVMWHNVYGTWGNPQTLV